MKIILMTAAALAIAPAQAAWAQSTRPGVEQTRPKPLPKPRKARPLPKLAPAKPATPIAFAPFKVTEVGVQGSSLSPALISAASRPYIGQTLDEAGLARLAQSVADVYGKSDIALYTIAIPDQDFAGGRVMLVAIEGRIGEVAIESAPPKANMKLVRAYAARMQAERPLRKKTLERYISLIRDIPGVTTEIDLQRTDQIGVVRLVLKPKLKKFQAGIGINTRGTAQLGRTQISVDLFGNSLLTQGDRLQASVAFPTDLERFQYYTASYQAPIGTNGTTGGVTFAYLKTKPKGSGVTGDARIAALSVSHPLIRGYESDLYLTGSFEALNSENALFGQSLSDERTRVVRTGVAYGRTRERSALSARATASFGIDGLGARSDDPLSSKTDFRKVTGDVAWDRAIGKPFAVRLRGTLQATDDPLPASEQFALGGDQYGRAFEASALVGDQGLAGSAELAYAPRKLPKPIAGTEVYGFVDAGRVWINARPGFDETEADLASAGAGVRLSVFSKGVLEVEGARAVEAPTGRDDDWRLVFSYRTKLD